MPCTKTGMCDVKDARSLAVRAKNEPTRPTPFDIIDMVQLPFHDSWKYAVHQQDQLGEATAWSREERKNQLS